MEGLELVVVIGATLVFGGAIAGRIRVPTSLVLLVLGAVLGFIPFLGDGELEPEVVLLLFLPALLYWESLNTSLREIKRNLRVILLQGIVLVIITAGIVAWVGQALGLPWPIALALGAILAPTDATAVAAVAGRLPRRALTTLRAESLINDGTALVIYAIAVGAAVSGAAIDLGGAALQFTASYVFGILIGLAVAAVIIGVRRLITERLVASTLSVLTPFLAYLPAEAFGVSGVVAVVVCGLTLSWFAPQIITASQRSQSFGFWQVATYILNGALFVLIGFELHHIVDDLGVGWATTIGAGLLISVVVVGTRLVWANTTPYVIRLVDRRPKQRALRVGWRQRFPLAWAGFRGAVSLAAALALPTQTAAGEPLPGREFVIAITFIVILFTLLVQGLTMPAIVRWAKLPPDPTELDDELLAEQAGLRAALVELPAAAARVHASPEIVDQLRAVYEERLGSIHRESDDPAEAYREESDFDTKARLQLELLPAKRDALLALRNAGKIDDVILRRVQARIDLEELRLSDAAEDE